MPTAASAVSICNSALARLGSVDRITSLDDSLRGVADSLRAVWDEQLRMLLDDHPWNDFIARARLNRHATDPLCGYEFAYRVPADCVRWLPWADEDAEWFEGELEGETILTNHAGPLFIRYISRDLAENVANWPPRFEQAMIAALCAALAYAVTQSMSVTDRMADFAYEALRKAKRKDGLENGRRRRRRNPHGRSGWLDARRTFYVPHGR